MLPSVQTQSKSPPLSISNNNQRRLSIISKHFDNESHNQQQIQVIDAELSEPLPSTDGITNRRRLTQIISIVENNEEKVVKPKGRYLLLFIIEPILTSCFLFPLVVLFWDCGWNLIITMLNSLNRYPLTYKLHEKDYTNYEYGNYSPKSLIVSYVINEILLLIFHLGQNLFYNFLKQQHTIVQMILMKIHAFILVFLYIVQWEMIWTILDQYTSQEWAFMMVLSLAAVFALIVVTGTLSDLVCPPFVVSYDSIEYCIQFECPLEMKNVSRWKINLINFILYEIIISNITIIIWHGFYTILDQYLYPDDKSKSICICLLIGYLLYFPLMYCQYYFTKLNLKYKFWTIFTSNFPQFHRNIVHGLAFASCLFIWRGFWIVYDTYLRIFEEYYKTYLLISLLIFGFLSIMQTFSSTNGPLTSMEDNYCFFPVYPHCYISKVVHNLSQLSYFQSKKTIPATTIFHLENSKNDNEQNNDRI